MISIDSRNPKPLYEQVVDEFKKLIVAGVMAPDEKLPSVRSLASQLAINPNTIQRAYRELQSAGFTYSAAGKGSFVAELGDMSSLHRDELLAQFDQVTAELLGLGCSADELTARIGKGGAL